MKLFEGIKLNKEDSRHLYIQLYKSIKDLILFGELQGEDRLPPVRRMSEILSVNSITVVKAYQLLEQEGLVYKRIGSGTYISPSITSQINIPEGSTPTATDADLLKQGHVRIEKNTINFASATPSADLFPVEDFKLVINEVLDRDQGNAFIYQESQGYYPLRCILKEYIGKQGIEAEVENIQIISGAQQGIDIIAKAFLNYGDYIIIESPSYTGAIAAFQNRGAKILDIPLEMDGLNLETLENKIKAHQPKLIYVMPNFQNPTGISYSREKKLKILEICKKYNVYLIEDDYLSDLSFYAEDNSTLKSLDKYERVIYIKSFSKIFMPGLRLGFLVIPRLFYNNLLVAKHSSDISTSGLIQRAFQLYLSKGIWERHLSFIEEKYKERFDKMVACIYTLMPKEIACYIPKGGLNFWFKLPKNISVKEVNELAIKENVAIAPGNLFFLNNGGTNYFRLSIAAMSVDEIQTGMLKLTGIIKDYLAGKEALDTQENTINPIL